ncbi:MAG: helicase-related protein [Alphaproteobacteria bacterium]
MSAFPPRLAAVLGPTNTGKTHLAVERMLAHASGMIGFPLRLLARETYDRVVRLAGARAAALVTGEERIVPPEARYYICTVEAMPKREVAFLAVDEIQLAADPERGHAFTDRLLHWRGREETMFVGADTIRPLIRRLLPGIEIVGRPRFSRLSHDGAKTLARLPPRSAVVAFSVEDVYALAESMRRRRGGAAVVMGALSPRTRNAQVDLFQSGEVDYLVATDAIGMGLNMDLHHVAFARLDKFDGRHMRRLTRAELAQIAGRAGRHMRDGTFGVTGEARPLEPETVAAIEDHRFEPLRHLYWRNSDLDERSLAGLLGGLDELPPLPELRRKRDADDHLALLALARAPDIARLATSPDAVRLLWQVAQIPDFRKTMSEAHASLLARIYRHLMDSESQLPGDWVAGQLSQLDRTDGDIDALTQRIAHVRTWTYISHRADWLADPGHWQGRARALEDRLSDALHARLTERFVDRRAAALARRLDSGQGLLGSVAADGRVMVEGEGVGRLEGFRFVAENTLQQAVVRAAEKVVRDGLARRVASFEASDDGDFALGDDGRITWRGAVVARLRRGERPLSPGVRLLGAEHLDARQQARAEHRLRDYLARHLGLLLPQLSALAKAELKGPARGVAFRLVERLGCLDRRAVASLLAAHPEIGEALRAIGVRVGLTALCADDGPGVRALRALLWSVANDRPPPGEVPAVPSFPAGPAADEDFLASCGYLVLGGRAARVDRLERLAREARALARQGAFQPTARLARTIGGSVAELPAMLLALGYRDEGGGYAPARPKARGARRRRWPRGRVGAGASPFAKLRDLKLAE